MGYNSNTYEVVVHSEENESLMLDISTWWGENKY
jgi:hypothetical protein